MRYLYKKYEESLTKPRLSLEDLYNQLDLMDIFPFRPNPTPKLLDDLTQLCQQESCNSHFGQRLSSIEKQRMGKSPTLCEFLFSIVAKYITDEKDVSLAEKWLQTTKHILTHFSNEVLQKEFTFRYADPDRSRWLRKTSLSLAFEALEELKFLNAVPFYRITQPAGGISAAFHARWKNEVILYLMTERHVSPDRGRISTSPILVYCFENLSKDDALDYDIVDKLIQLTSNKKPTDDENIPLKNCGKIAVVDRQRNTFLTALGAAVIMHWPISMLKRLIALGANVNVCFENSLFEFTRVPLLTYAIKCKNYTAMALLLENNADPNQVPSITSKCGYETFRLLTPYQFAVDSEDTKAIELFSAWMKQHEGKLKTQLHPEEALQRRYGWMFMPKGSRTLSSRAETAIFEVKDHLLTELYDKYKIRVFAENHDYKDSILALFDDLFGSLTQDSACKRTTLLVNTLNEVIKKNPMFKFTFIDNSNLMPKSVCGYFDNDTCNEIVIITRRHVGLVTTLVHELGHLFESRHGGLGKIPGFANAIKKDDITPKKIAALPKTIRAQLEDIPHAYEDECEQLAEYFARICFQIPIMLSLDNNNEQTDNADTLMYMHFPSISSWFENAYIARIKPIINDPVEEIGTSIDDPVVCNALAPIARW